jgi:L-glyceraldehyde 3-phosphate reductase
MYIANQDRYQQSMPYLKCGNSGLSLPAISLGLWHNFGGVDYYENCKDILRTAFDQGVTHFDLANNYGPPAGSAEETFGKMLKTDFRPYRDEMVIATKAGYGMWDGPYGDGGSRKYLISSLDQSLKRMGIDYVDIYYHHRFDTETPLEESISALAHVYRQGKALYIGISNYNAEQTLRASNMLKELGVPCLVNQSKINMLEQEPKKEGLLDLLDEQQIGFVAFSPLAQGMLTDRYLQGIPEGSRADKAHGFLQKESITDGAIVKVKKLNELAEKRGQSLAQMAISWILSQKAVTSVIVGASSSKQLLNNLGAAGRKLSCGEIEIIDSILR